MGDLVTDLREMAARWATGAAPRDERRETEPQGCRRELLSRLDAESNTEKLGPLLAAEINALPLRVRAYVHDLEVRCDPAGTIQELACARENVTALAAAAREAHAAGRREGLEEAAKICDAYATPALALPVEHVAAFGALAGEILAAQSLARMIRALSERPPDPVREAAPELVERHEAETARLRENLRRTEEGSAALWREMRELRAGVGEATVAIQEAAVVVSEGADNLFAARNACDEALSALDVVWRTVMRVRFDPEPGTQDQLDAQRDAKLAMAQAAALLRPWAKNRHRRSVRASEVRPGERICWAAAAGFAPVVVETVGDRDCHGIITLTGEGRLLHLHADSMVTIEARP